MVHPRPSFLLLPLALTALACQGAPDDSDGAVYETLPLTCRDGYALGVAHRTSAGRLWPRRRATRLSATR